MYVRKGVLAEAVVASVPFVFVGDGTVVGVVGGVGEEGVGLVGLVDEVCTEICLASLPEMRLAVEKLVGSGGVDASAESLHKAFAGLEVDDSAAALRIIFCRRGDHKLHLVYGVARAAFKEVFEVFAGKIGRASVYPYGHSLSVEFHIAVLVYGHSRGIAQHVESVTGLCHSEFRHIHHYLVEVLFQKFPFAGHDCRGENCSVFFKDYGLECHRVRCFIFYAGCQV